MEQVPSLFKVVRSCQNCCCCFAFFLIHISSQTTCGLPVKIWEDVFDFCWFYFTTVLPHWDFSHGKFGLLSSGKVSCDRVALPNPHTIISVTTIHRIFTWISKSLTCAQRLIYATAHWGAWTPKESLHWKLTLGEKPLPHRRIESASAACRSDALPTELHPHPHLALFCNFTPV